jgi:hypothetical protein
LRAHGGWRVFRPSRPAGGHSIVLGTPSPWLNLVGIPIRLTNAVQAATSPRHVTESGGALLRVSASPWWLTL